MMNTKRLLCMSLIFALLLSATGCVPVEEGDPTGTPGRVEDPFAQPTPTPASPSAPTSDPARTAPPAAGTPGTTSTAAPTEQPAALSGFSSGMSFGLAKIEDDIERGNDVEYVDDKNTSLRYRVYSGGEMRLPIMFSNIRGYEELGVGVLLFVDGVPQPYRVEGETEYSYLHTFYLEDGTYYPDLYFIPVTGQKGDRLEFWAKVIEEPEIAPTKDNSGFCYSTSGFAGGGSYIQFNADPPAQKLPETTNRILSQTVSYADTTLLEIGSWSADDLMRRISVKCTTPDMDDDPMFSDRYNISADDPVRVRFEMYGSPLVDHRLVYFLDNVPVATDIEKIAFIEVESGRKTIVETVIDLTGFDGFSILYPVLVPVNSQISDAGERQPLNYCYAQSPVTFRLTSGANHTEMLEMNAARVAVTP